MSARQFVYRYDGDPKTEEAEQDLDGEILFRKKALSSPERGRPGLYSRFIGMLRPPLFPCTVCS